MKAAQYYPDNIDAGWWSCYRHPDSNPPHEALRDIRQKSSHRRLQGAEDHCGHLRDPQQGLGRPFPLGADLPGHVVGQRAILHQGRIAPGDGEVR